MNDKKGFLDKVTSFVFGEPIPVLSQDDLQTIQDLNQKLDLLLDRLNGNRTGPPEADGRPANPGQPAPERPSPWPGTAESAAIHDSLADLSEQVRKLAKTQFKANTLQESQLSQQEAVVEDLRQSIGQQEKRLADLDRQREQAVETAQLELLAGLLPILDSLDAAFDTGRRQVLQLPMNPEVRRAIIAWLDGIRLARMRLLDLLAAHEVTPIAAVGQPFDPHLHIAVATETTTRAPDQTVIGEDRRGYATPTKVLREAEVVVARSK